jgi:DNA (cytosine-5)-methyltransferase 1
MNELHLFAGAGGGILGGMLLGHTTVCAVELEPYCRKVLLQRQRDGILPRFPIWDDVCTFNGNPWKGKVDVVCGGFPCQDISAAGKGAGITGERSGLWSEMARIIGEIRPKYAFVENSPMLTLRGLNRVLGDLSEMGYDARWGVVGAYHVGAPHRRERIWIVANSKEEWTVKGFQMLQARRLPRKFRRVFGCQWLRELDFPVTHGNHDEIPNFLDRHFAIGNAQVPAVAALAWRILGGE